MKELEYSKINFIYLIIWSFFFFLFLLGLIGFNILIHYSTTDFLLALVIEIAKQLSPIVNLFLVFMVFIFGVPFTLKWRKFIRVIIPKLKKKLYYTDPEVEEKILRVLARKKGKFFSPTYLIKKINFKGTLVEFKSILQHLREENRIKFDKDDYPYYNVMLP